MNEPVEHSSQNYQLQNQANRLRPQDLSPDATIGSVKAIEFKESVSVATLVSTRKLSSFVFLQKVFKVFEQHAVGFDLVTISEIAVSVVLDNIEKLRIIEQSLSGVATLKIETGKATVCLSFAEMQDKNDLPGKIFQAIEKINLSFITQSDAGKKLAFVINQSEIDAVAFTLFEQFFEKGKAVAIAPNN
jgi:aspartokinase